MLDNKKSHECSLINQHKSIIKQTNSINKTNAEYIYLSICVYKYLSNRYKSCSK